MSAYDDARQAADQPLIARRIELLHEIPELLNASDNAERAEIGMNNWSLGLADVLLLLHTTEVDLEHVRRLDDLRDVPEDEPGDRLDQGLDDERDEALERALCETAIEAFRQGRDVLGSIEHRVIPVSLN